MPQRDPDAFMAVVGRDPDAFMAQQSTPSYGFNDPAFKALTPEQQDAASKSEFDQFKQNHPYLSMGLRLLQGDPTMPLAPLPMNVPGSLPSVATNAVRIGKLLFNNPEVREKGINVLPKGKEALDWYRTVRGALNPAPPEPPVFRPVSTNRPGAFIPPIEATASSATSAIDTSAVTLQNDIAKQYYGKSYSSLTPDQMRAVDAVVKAAKAPELTPPPAAGEPVPSASGEARTMAKDKYGEYDFGKPSAYQNARAGVNAENLAKSLHERGITVEQARNFTEEQWQKEAAPFWRSGNPSAESRKDVLLRLSHRHGETWPMVELPPPPKAH